MILVISVRRYASSQFPYSHR